MPSSPSLWRNPDFRKFWTGQSVAALSATVTALAVPLIAVLTLHASPFAMGLLGTAATLPNLLLGLGAGIVVDRHRRRPIMIGADLGRVFALLSIPVAALFGALTIWQLALVLFISGICMTFSDVANLSYVPSLVGRDQLVSANSKLVASTAVASAVGPGLAGLLIQLLTAPLAIITDAVSLVLSTMLLTRIRTTEPPPEYDHRSSLWHELRDGMRLLFVDLILRAFAISSGTYLFFSSIAAAVYVLYATRDLGITAGTLGLLFGAGGAGAVAGALLATQVTNLFGAGPAMIGADLVAGLCMILVPLAAMTPSAVPLLLLAQVGSQSMGATFTIIQTSLRQARTPDHLLGRMNASYRFLTMGMIPLGSLLGGALGATIGVQATLAVASLGMLLPAVWLFLSPVRSLGTVESDNAVREM